MEQEVVVKSFDNVDISDSMEALKEPVEQQETIKEEKEEPAKENADDTGANPEVEGEPEDPPAKEEALPSITIGDDKYDEEKVREFRDDSLNKEKWQKANTEKAQEIAEQRKAIEPLVQLVSKLKDKGELSNDIKNALVAEFGEEISSIWDSTINFDPEKFIHPSLKELNEAKETIRQKEETDKLLEKASEQSKALKIKYKLNDDDIEKIYVFAEDHAEKNDIFLSIEEYYKLSQYDNMKKDIDKKPAKRKPKVPVLPPKGKGIKDLKTEKPKSFEELNDDPAWKGVFGHNDNS